MITDNLYNEILLRPVHSQNANTLYIVSGYASATFARKHLLDLKDRSDFAINLIIGMPRSKYDHLAFVQLQENFKGRFKAYYYNGTPPVHCKIFAWFNQDVPIIGYSGSANYSQYGFFDHLQKNQMTKDDPLNIFNYYNSLIGDSTLISEFKAKPLIEAPLLRTDNSVEAGKIRWTIPNKRVDISFLDNKGNLPMISGLNWGQRREKRINKVTGEINFVTREPNQAYLSLRLDSRKEGFLPDRAYTFTLITDDNNSFDCVVAQDGRKAIHSTNDNSELGRYIRKRLGVQIGAPVTKNDLQKYGRTDYTIEKLNGETFLFDFSVSK